MRSLVVTIIVLGAVTSLVALDASADMGLFSISAPRARLYEPTQDALIAWNGSEELLLLMTEVHASEPTKVLEILPLPTEPVVTKGSRRAFARFQELVDQRVGQAKAADGAELHEPFGDDPPAGRITQRKTIGAHDISVAQVVDAARFASWVEGYLRDKKLPSARLPEDLLALISTYTKGGFRWFVLDVIEVGKRRVGRDPIAYHFKTSSFFYPLRISRRAEGRTRVQVSTIAPRPLSFNAQRVDAAGQRPHRPRPPVRCHEPFRPFRISTTRASALDPAIAALLSASTGAWCYLGRVHCVGKLASFDQDLTASLGPEPPAPRVRPRKAAKGGGASLSNPFE
jgi:hypothetical protein